MEAWHASASEPLMLRVPRGMALSLLGGALLLLMLAYWVGHSRGSSAAEQRVRAEFFTGESDAGRLPPEAFHLDENPVQGSETAVTPTRDPKTEADPRIPGRNYLVLALYPYDEAKRLQRFLAGHEVEVLVGPRNNKGLCQVVALTGFTGEQMRSTDAAERFRNRLLSLGRDWKASNDNKGDDLSTMYYSKYVPPAGP